MLSMSEVSCLKNASCCKLCSYGGWGTSNSKLWPRLCRVAIQKAFGLATLQQMIDEGKTCTCTSAGVTGSWEHFYEAAGGWEELH